MIKKFTMDALVACAELYAQTFNAPPWNDKWTVETASARLQEFVGHKRFFGFTLWEAGTLVGAVFCRAQTFYFGEEAYVDELFISPDCQRKGRGTALMQAVEAYAKEHSLVSITLLTSKEMPSFRFYEKLGWKHSKSMVFMHKRIE